MINISVRREKMIDVLCGGMGEIIYDKVTHVGRWDIHHELVFTWIDGKHYKTKYVTGATEYQITRPWDDVKEVVCMEVEPVKKTTIVYEPVGG